MHRLPSGLKTKFISDTGGNLSASVVAEVRKAFEEDNLVTSEKGTSKAVVFCNSDSRVRQISRKFGEKGLVVLCWTSKGVEDGTGKDVQGTRQRGKQGELSAFLSSSTNRLSPTKTSSTRVLVTTSLLSRGLDFSSAISTVVLVDPPRDALDFVHRAGRTARAGRKGRVIVFGMGGKGDVRGFNNKGRGLKGRVGEEVSRVIRQRK
jgi:ATP-dependent RNA helicase MRH4